jgi:hypothetical protein
VPFQAAGRGRGAAARAALVIRALLAAAEGPADEGGPTADLFGLVGVVRTVGPAVPGQPLGPSLQAVVDDGGQFVTRQGRRRRRGSVARRQLGGHVFHFNINKFISINTLIRLHLFGQLIKLRSFSSCTS